MTKFGGIYDLIFGNEFVVKLFGGGLFNESNLILARVLFFVLLFALLFALLTFVFGGGIKGFKPDEGYKDAFNKKIRAVIALVMSLITVSIIPSRLLRAIATAWGVVFVFVLIAPVLLGGAFLLFSNKVFDPKVCFNRLIKALIALLLWYITGVFSRGNGALIGVESSVDLITTQTFGAIVSFTEYASAIFLFIAIYFIISLIFCKKEGAKKDEMNDGFRTRLTLKHGTEVVKRHLPLGHEPPKKPSKKELDYKGLKKLYDTIIAFYFKIRKQLDNLKNMPEFESDQNASFYADLKKKYDYLFDGVSDLATGFTNIVTWRMLFDYKKIAHELSGDFSRSLNIWIRDLIKNYDELKDLIKKTKAVRNKKDLNAYHDMLLELQENLEKMEGNVKGLIAAIKLYEKNI